MKCDGCEYEFDTVALKANQGTQIVCPSCGLPVTVRYSLRDQLRDISGLLRRDPKYVSQQTLRVILFVVCSVVFLLFIILVLIKK